MLASNFIECAFLLCLLPVISINAHCGLSKDSAEESGHSRAKRVISGNQAPPGKYPWQAILECETEGGDEIETCGGTVVGNRWILTAAHCIYDPKLTKCLVKVGASEVAIIEEEDTYHSEAIYFNEYDDDAMDNDIALVKLDRPVQYRENIQPVCLPSRDQKVPSTIAATVIGYGRHSFPGDALLHNSTTDVLLETQVPVLDFDDCVIHWKDVDESQICAGEQGHGAGKGDSGGPLLLQSTDQRWFEIGVTSFGIDDQKIIDQDNTEVFARVSHYCDWIEETSDDEVQCAKETTEFV